METVEIPEVDRQRRSSIKVELQKAVEEREREHQEIEENKKRRGSIKNEIQKVVEEREKTQEEKENIKDFAKNKLFPEIQKEIEAHTQK